MANSTFLPVSSASGILLAEQTLDADQIIAANQPAGLGHIIVAAPGAGWWLYPLFGTMTMVRPAAFNFSPAWSLNWRGIGAFPGSPAALTNAAAVVQTNIDTNYLNFNNGNVNAVKSTSVLENKALVLCGNISGLLNGAGSKYTFQVAYYLMKVPV